MPTAQEKRNAFNRAADLLTDQQIRAQYPEGRFPPLGWTPTGRDRARANRMRIRQKMRRQADAPHVSKVFETWGSSTVGSAVKDFMAMNRELFARGYSI